MTELKNISLAFGDKVIFESFSHTFADRKITAIMGASGIGKTTLLRILAGLCRPDCGSVRVDRPIALLFQEPRLCPWLTVTENLRLVLGKKSSAAMIDRWLARVRLEGEGNRMPSELSGGMLQRVSLARTLAYADECSAGLLLLDEPFKGLDPELHDEMLGLIAERSAGRTTVLVTHDPADSERLCHELLRL